MDGTNNRLITFLAMIAGAEDVTPVEPRTELEYWLNEIAAAKGGNPWVPETEASGIEARLVIGDLQLEETPAYPMYMLDLDLGIDELPKSEHRAAGRSVSFAVEGKEYKKAAFGSKDIHSDPLSPQVSSIGDPDKYELGNALSLRLIGGEHDLGPELSNLPGVFIGLVCAYFYHGDKTIHAQMFFLLSDDMTNHVPYDDADTVRINVSFDHWGEHVDPGSVV